MKNNILKLNTKFKLRYIFYTIFIVILILGFIFTHFGGFGTGESVDTNEFSIYAKKMEDFSIPSDKNIIALGEATHGNSEFQKLKLDILKELVENYNVRSFILEGDFGGCENVNRYIQTGNGNLKDIVSSIGFEIYKTEEMMELIEYMRYYNSTHKNDIIRFYGVDMQRLEYNFKFLIEYCKKSNIPSNKVESLFINNKLNNNYSNEERIDILKKLKERLNSPYAIQIANILIQNFKLDSIKDLDSASAIRDKFMAENLEWVYNMEKSLGHDKIFVSAHNIHVAKWASYDSMGKIISKKFPNEYYVIGTDFYKTKCNLATKKGRKNKVFYSRNPLAKASKLLNFDISWIEFDSIKKSSNLFNSVNNFCYLGSIGDYYSVFNKLVPYSYRIFQPPAQMYDGMILVTNATPINNFN